MQTTSSKRRLCWESLGRGGRSSLDDCCDWNGRCLILGSVELSLQVIAWRFIGSLNAGDHPVAPLCIRFHRRRTFGQRCQVRFWAWAHMALVQTSPRPWGTSSKYRQHAFIKSGSARATYKHDMYGDCLLLCWIKYLTQVFSLIQSLWSLWSVQVRSPPLWLPHLVPFVGALYLRRLYTKVRNLEKWFAEVLCAHMTISGSMVLLSSMNMAQLKASTGEVFQWMWLIAVTISQVFGCAQYAWRLFVVTSWMSSFVSSVSCHVFFTSNGFRCCF